MFTLSELARLTFLFFNGGNMALQREEISGRVRDLALPIAQSMVFELVDIEYKRTGREALLRLFIDKEGGVTLDDCAGFSRELSTLLDIEDFIPCEYNLEVSSPGLERPLKSKEDFERFAGRLIKVKTFEPYQDDVGNKRKTFLGRLDSLKDGSIYMELDEGQTASIPLERVAKAHLVFKF